MTRRHGLLALIVVAIWGSNFVVIKVALDVLPPLWPAAIAQGLSRAGGGTWAAVIWQAAGNALFGYGVWAWLLARYPAATVAPMALLVPVFGMGASALVLGEGLPPWKLAAAALVIGGLALNLLWPRPRDAATRPTS
jgi:O-acetylserine/cysteine efflux transporter